MSDVALIELRQLRAELPRLVADAVRAALASASKLSPPEQDAVDALGLVFGASALTTREVVAALDMPIGHRPALRLALQALVPGLDRQRVGLALRRIADRGGIGTTWRLQCASIDRGRVWTLQRVHQG